MRIANSIVFIFLFTSVSIGQNDKIAIDFATDIKPILEDNCLRCHCEEDDQGGCRLDSRDLAMDYIEEGDAENSVMFEYITSEHEDEMMPPPDEGGPLDDSDISMIETWINEGAEWPEGLMLTAVQDGDQEAANESDTSQPQDDQQAGPNVYYAIGSLHPAVLHLPMGLLLAAGFFALLSLRGNFVMSDCAYYCLWLGTFGAIAACVTGWWFVLDQMPGEYVESAKLVEGLKNTDHRVFWHRTSALIATAFALILALFAASARNRDPDDGIGWKLGLIVLAAGIGFVGHQGGKLTWKSSHYDELFDVIEHYAPGLIPSDDNNDPNPAEAEASATPGSQDSSDSDVET